MKGTAIARLCERERGDQLAIGHAYGSMAMVDYGGFYASTTCTPTSDTTNSSARKDGTYAARAACSLAVAVTRAGDARLCDQACPMMWVAAWPHRPT
eukprot:scaffold60321_cov32-Tisochrysis_lutea.AAC.1